MVENKDEKQINQPTMKKKRNTSFVFEMINPFDYKKSNLMLLLAFVIGLIFDVIFVHRWGDGIWIWFFIFEVILLFIFREAILKTTKKDFPLIFSISISLIISLWFAIFNNFMMSFFYKIILLILNAFILLHMAWVSKAIPVYKYPAFYLVILKKIKNWINLWIQETKWLSKQSSLIKTILLSLVVLWLMLFFIIPILISADAVFAKILNTYVLQYFNLDMFSIFQRLVVVFLVWIFTWTGMIILNNLKTVENRPEIIQFDIKNLWSNIVLVGINIVYLLFILVQIKYLFFGNHQMIVDLWLNSYAEYIHKWFWELMIIALFNFLVFRIIQKSLKKENNNLMVKSMLILLMTFSIVIIWSAFKRIYMYVDAYWLTESRIFVFYIIFMIFALMSFCIYKIFKAQASYQNYLIVVFLSSFTLLWYMNIDKTIAKYNIEHNILVKATYNDSSFNRSIGFRKSTALDWNYIFTLSEDAIDEQLYLLSKDEALLQKYNCKYSKIVSPSFLHLNYYRLKIKNLWKCEIKRWI